MEKRNSGVQVQSVARAAEILNCFLQTPELGISEIAAEMGLNKSTVFGLVNTLATYGYLEQVASTKKYRLGITLFEMGNLVLSRIDIRNEAKYLCASLAENIRRQSISRPTVKARSSISTNWMRGHL